MFVFLVHRGILKSMVAAREATRVVLNNGNHSFLSNETVTASVRSYQQNVLFSKIWVPNSGCGLSASAAYTSVNTVVVCRLYCSL